LGVFDKEHGVWHVIEQRLDRAPVYGQRTRDGFDDCAKFHTTNVSLGQDASCSDAIITK
jgi:hypothetical protein